MADSDEQDIPAPGGPPPALPDIDSPPIEDVLEQVPSTEEIIEHAESAEEIVKQQPGVDELLHRDSDPGPQAPAPQDG